MPGIVAPEMLLRRCASAGTALAWPRIFVTTAGMRHTWTVRSPEAVQTRESVAWNRIEFTDGKKYVRKESDKEWK